MKKKHNGVRIIFWIHSLVWIKKTDLSFCYLVLLMSPQFLFPGSAAEHNISITLKTHCWHKTCFHEECGLREEIARQANVHSVLVMLQANARRAHIS